MNLVRDKWIPVARADGSLDTIAPWEIGASGNPVVEIKAPRPDFRGALYQFLIGLVQTTFAPEDDDEWEEKWKNAPTCDDLRTAFEKHAEAFELFSEGGPAFMQDLRLPETAKAEEIQSLLIDSPGDKAEDENRCHFVKSRVGMMLCESCTATALFALQTNASSGGAGHRTGLRGGGPLTTLVVPATVGSNLWVTVWLNTMSTDEKFNASSGPIPEIYPWLSETRDSEPPQETKEEKANRLALRRDLSPKQRERLKKDREAAKAIHPYLVNELQQYWGTPRRIRLAGMHSSGTCCCCGIEGATCNAYRSKNYGCNYASDWQHVLSPYYRRKEEDGSIALIAQKGKAGGYCYADWVALTIGGGEDELAAVVVKSFNERKHARLDKSGQYRVWCFGYDMDKDKTRCWYDLTMPLIVMTDTKREGFLSQIQSVIASANEAAEALEGQVKTAWAGVWSTRSNRYETKDFKGDIGFVRKAFWEETENTFYSLAEKLHGAIESGQATNSMLAGWRGVVIESATQIFDRYALQVSDQPRDAKRIAAAAQALSTILTSKKTKAIQALLT
jgi:CRISPR system Cascade subunit CasA